MARKGRPSPHQAAELGHVHIEQRKSGQVVGHEHKWFGRCHCGWECKYTRATKDAAVDDWREHAGLPRRHHAQLPARRAV